MGRDGDLSTLCHSCGFACQQRELKKFPDPGSSAPIQGSLTMIFTGKFVYMAHHFIFLCVNPSSFVLGLIERDSGWNEYSVS